MNHANPFVPKAITQASQGLRPSVRNLMDLIDTSDPAFRHIAAEIQRYHNSGTLIDAPGVLSAIIAGRESFDRATVRAKTVYPASIVYYIRRGHLIKIGTTRQPRSRMRDLLPDEIVAWEPGDFDTERSRHRQFAHIRIRGSELFQHSENLTEHMKQLREQHGEPSPEWPTTQTIEQIAARIGKPAPAVSPELVTAHKGAELLGVRMGTIAVWVHRQKLTAQATDWQGKPLYHLDDIQSLAEKGRARKSPTRARQET